MILQTAFPFALTVRTRQSSSNAARFAIEFFFFVFVPANKNASKKQSNKQTNYGPKPALGARTTSLAAVLAAAPLFAPPSCSWEGWKQKERERKERNQTSTSAQHFAWMLFNLLHELSQHLWTQFFLLRRRRLFLLTTRFLQESFVLVNQHAASKLVRSRLTLDGPPRGASR